MPWLQALAVCLAMSAGVAAEQQQPVDVHSGSGWTLLGHNGTCPESHDGKRVVYMRIDDVKKSKKGELWVVGADLQGHRKVCEFPRPGGPHNGGMASWVDHRRVAFRSQVRRMGSLRITWAENDTSWRLTACQRVLLEDCDRYRGAYVQELDAICERAPLRSLRRWTTTTRFPDEADRECLPAWDEHGAIEGGVAHLTRDGHPQRLAGAGPWVADVGLLAALGAIGAEGAATWRLKQAARQIRFLGSGFPTGRVANGRTAFFPAEDLVASVPGDGTVLLVARHEIGERNGQRVYPRVRGALSEVQVTLTAEGLYGRICRVYGSSAVDGDDFELFRLTIDLDPG